MISSKQHQQQQVVIAVAIYYSFCLLVAAVLPATAILTILFMIYINVIVNKTT